MCCPLVLSSLLTKQSCKKSQKIVSSWKYYSIQLKFVKAKYLQIFFKFGFIFWIEINLTLVSFEKVYNSILNIKDNYDCSSSALKVKKWNFQGFGLNNESKIRWGKTSFKMDKHLNSCYYRAALLPKILTIFLSNHWQQYSVR